jgi:hypothetical protein
MHERSATSVRKIGALGVAAALAATMAFPLGAFAQDEMMDDAMVRILHGADAPNVDIYVNGDAAVTDLAFGADTGYVSLPGGEYLIQVVPAGSALEDDNVVIEATVPFESGTKSTVIATGNLDDGLAAQLEADEPAPPADMTQIKVGHMSWDAPAVDIAVDGGDVIVPDLPFPEVTDYLTVPGGAYDLEVRVAGTEDVALDLDELNLRDGVAYSAYAIGSLANESLMVVPLVDMDTRAANVRVGHFSPDAPAVDVFANGAAILEGVTFGGISPYLEVPAGEYQIQVAPEGAGVDAAVIDAVLTFGPGSWTTVAAANDVADIQALVFKDRAPGPDANVAKVRAYHASADAPKRVDIATDGAGKKKAVVKKLRFGKASRVLDLPEGTIDLDIRQPNKKKVLLDIDPLELEAGTVYSVFAVTGPDGVTVIPNVDAATE